MKLVKLGILVLTLGIFATSCGNGSGDAAKNDSTAASTTTTNTTTTTAPAKMDTPTAAPAKPDTAKAAAPAQAK